MEEMRNILASLPEKGQYGIILMGRWTDIVGYEVDAKFQ